MLKDSSWHRQYYYWAVCTNSLAFSYTLFFITYVILGRLTRFFVCYTAPIVCVVGVLDLNVECYLPMGTLPPYPQSRTKATLLLQRNNKFKHNFAPLIVGPIGIVLHFTYCLAIATRVRKLWRTCRQLWSEVSVTTNHKKRLHRSIDRGRYSVDHQSVCRCSKKRSLFQDESKNVTHNLRHGGVTPRSQSDPCSSSIACKQLEGLSEHSCMLFLHFLAACIHCRR